MGRSDKALGDLLIGVIVSIGKVLHYRINSNSI
jgi:hypothetical protein